LYGYDEISTKILKISYPFISSPLNYVCNKILFQDVFPDRLKYAVIKPLHKNGDRYEVSNYRPVSLLTSFSKIFEMVMRTRILKHLTNYNILSNEPYGFRIELKTDNAIYKLTTEILNALNNKLLKQKGAYYLGIKILNNLPLEIKNVAGNQKKVQNCSEKNFIHLLILYNGRVP